MAIVPKREQSTPTRINKFLGLNESSDGDTELLPGESPSMVNFRVTDGYKLAKREGYELLFDTGTSSAIRGMWHGEINNVEKLLISCAGTLYNYSLTSSTSSVVASVANNTTSFFSFSNKVYILDGTEYKSYDGSTCIAVVGYVPLIAIDTPPTGGGTDYEQINVLTGKKHQQFDCNGTSSVYTLAEANITSVDAVLYASNTVSTASYSVNLTTAAVTFTTSSISGWASGENNIDIYWTKGTGSRQIVTANLYSMYFGGDNDTRVHLWGNTSNQNTIIYSDLADGVPSAEYFPALNYSQVGSNEFAVTDVVRQYDRRLIFTESDSWYSSYYATTDDNGNKLVSFPTYPLNQVKGNKAAGQTRIIQNNPVTVFDGIYEWVATNVRDERNAKLISKKIQPSLSELSLPTAITYDWEEKSEYWICIGSTVFVWHYINDTWSKFDNIPAKCFLVIAGEMYFGSSTGKVYKFDSALRADVSTSITASWESGFLDFGAEFLKKYINMLWVSIKPEAQSFVDITYETNRDETSGTYTAEYHLATFDNMNFTNFSFNTNYKPQIFRFKIKAKKFAYFKIVLENDSAVDTVTILDLTFKNRFGGEIK
jgi:hypothetical protein